MQVYDIMPNVGVGPIKLGMNRDQVDQLIGNPISRTQVSSVYSYGLVISFDETNQVMGIAINKVRNSIAQYKGEVPLELPVQDCLALFGREEDPQDVEDGFTFIFPHKLNILLWRSYRPEVDGEDDLERKGYEFETLVVASEKFDL